MATVHRRPVFGCRPTQGRVPSTLAPPPDELNRSKPGVSAANPFALWSQSLSHSGPSAANAPSSASAPSASSASSSSSPLASNVVGGAGSVVTLAAPGGALKPDDFIYYSDSDEESDAAATAASLAAAQLRSRRLAALSRSFVDYHVQRQSGLAGFSRLALDRHYGTRHLLAHSMLQQRPVPVAALNKVFSSQWLGEDQIVFGTKCNKILVYNIRTHSLDMIPRLLSAKIDSAAPATAAAGGGGGATGGAAGGESTRAGVYCLSVNPSRTLLATCAENCVDLAVYRLPTLDPVCVGQGGHTDWIYDCTWLDDERVVTGGRDTCVTLWQAHDTDHYHYDNHDSASAGDRAASSSPPPTQPVTRHPLVTKRCKTADKVRSLVYNCRDSSLVTLSVNAYVHLFDMHEFRQKISRRLPHSMENVCLALCDQRQVYAVGSKSHTTLLEPRSLKVLKKVPAKYHGCGIRSLSFHGDLVTIGTGNSVVMFFDLRAQKYLDSGVSAGRAVVFKAGAGWASLPAAEEAVVGAVDGVYVDHTPAIYTHCYDLSGTRLFTAGGPLSAHVNGCYAGLWM